MWTCTVYLCIFEFYLYGFFQFLFFYLLQNNCFHFVYIILIIPHETRGNRFQLFRLSVCQASCPGYISKNTQWKAFRFHIQIEHQWKLCNAAFSFDLLKECENDRIFKMYENFDPVSRLYLPNFTLECYYPWYTDKSHTVQRCVLDQINVILSKWQTFVNS